MSNKNWMREHQADPYVKRAQQEGQRSRAVYKLLEINDKDKLFKSGMTVVDLGAAPGGWSVVARELVGQKGKVIALDRLEMEPITGVDFIQGDFTDDEVLDQLLQVLENKRVDLVISDMAPNISGMKSIDQPRVMYLAELAWDLAARVLKPGGAFLVKVFQGEGIDAYSRLLKPCFETLKFRKPKASKPKSREIYLIGIGFKV
ncbi:MAG: 23S rRNA (uridine(2552)-2'-O)-methyltransferase RlmE [Gammaproteobacteria bacterium]|nr:23S rRNA (uridine(2552)-2'-O)-methyltransferase RlmE [Gammaproteobacteria bacterium]